MKGKPLFLGTPNCKYTSHSYYILFVAKKFGFSRYVTTKFIFQFMKKTVDNTLINILSAATRSRKLLFTIVNNYGYSSTDASIIEYRAHFIGGKLPRSLGFFSKMRASLSFSIVVAMCMISTRDRRVNNQLGKYWDLP